ncbi:hypothetical protein VYU27_008101 [Nannochloropsis oceanica]
MKTCGTISSGGGRSHVYGKIRWQGQATNAIFAGTIKGETSEETAALPPFHAPAEPTQATDAAPFPYCCLLTSSADASSTSNEKKMLPVLPLPASTLSSAAPAVEIKQEQKMESQRS